MRSLRLSAEQVITREIPTCRPPSTQRATFSAPVRRSPSSTVGPAPAVVVTARMTALYVGVGRRCTERAAGQEWPSEGGCHAPADPRRDAARGDGVVDYLCH